MPTWVTSGDFGVVTRHTTSRHEGDFGIGADPDALRERRRRLVSHPWVWLRQVHGAEVVVVTADNLIRVPGTEADALVTAEDGVVLAVQTADCMPVTFDSPEGVIGVAHAGWRGLEAGVIEATVSAMVDLGASRVAYQVGPFIGPECYEFGADDLDRLAAGFGDGIRSVTAQGHGGLDLGELLAAVWNRAHDVVPDGRARPPGLRRPCTAENRDQWFSHRARGETERMATVIWREARHQDASTWASPEPGTGE
jgi:polyphenol oxidase